MLIFVFICKEMRERGAIWAAVGGFFRIFPGLSREEGDFWRDFWAEKAAGGEIWGPGGRHRALRARTS